ncbi:LysR family transcriptional regulator [Marinobacterium arenosum]|uniref:LysR family transcriptional regulator n=1 Tax=Marinobacterium arenosum TaxID=2862496 RepID=UPI001C9777D2|nr:LysR family transcriptional regulator [Marinobacterium arenosum]MBY4678095.1 LysR family transcriptional regulator [Marinobacterium arenosum]
MEQLNLNLLRALKQLLQERHVTRAAEQLHLTQSAMSRQLAQLRDYFQDPLLVREGNDLLLTARAQQLLPQVCDILARVDELRGEPPFEPARCSRRFVFACTDYVAQFIFPAVLSRLHREAPQLDISYRMWQPEWLGRLGQLPIDLASTTHNQLPDTLRSIPLGQDYPVCLMAADHPLTAEPRPTLEALLSYPYIRISSGGDKDSFLDRALKSQGFSRRIAFEVPFFSAAFSVLADSDRLLVVPAHIARNAARHYPLTSRPLPLAVPENRYHLFWHLLHDHDPAHRWLRELLAEAMRSSLYSPGDHQIRS